MTSNKDLAALAIFGLIVFTIVRYSEIFLTQLLSIVGVLVGLNPTIYNYLEIGPLVLVILIWAFFVFKYLNNFSGEINIITSNFSRQARRLGIIALLLYFWTTVLIVSKDYVIVAYSQIDYKPSRELLMTKIKITSVLGLIEFVIIVIGFFRIFGRSNTAANNT